MRKKVTLITGAVGEIGQALISKLAEQNRERLLTLDLRPLPDELDTLTNHIQGDILDRDLLARLVSEYEFEEIFHLAALLSTRAEFAPSMAHHVNVEGTMRLLHLAAEESERGGRSVKFIFPSSLAVYGMPDLATKELDAKVKEWEWNHPTTMYGCNKLYCELLGSYYSRNYHQLAAIRPVKIDFRCLRFPGLISAYTVPSGGTTDFAPEMIHAAAKGVPYNCFVREDTRIPFMAMPDAIRGLLLLSQAPTEKLSRSIYNITSFSLTANQIREKVDSSFPNAETTFQVDINRQAIVDTWPGDLNDRAAQNDWEWQPSFGVDRAFNEYLIPAISERYSE
jgi:nucleoside-diphosphate-sugar epimerase